MLQAGLKAYDKVFLRRPGTLLGGMNRVDDDDDNYQRASNEPIPVPSDVDDLEDTRKIPTITSEMER